jgi:mannitol PTS system EIICBA or EIICB component
VRARVQRFGAFLAGMVIPNIAAFIAWGLLTALVIPAGWLPNPRLAKLVDPTILYLLPMLIGFAGGRLVHGNRGGVVGAIAVMGVVVGSTVPMFLGAMIMGPLGGWLIRTFDRAVQGRIPAGFEMLVSNFSAGLAGLGLMLAGYTVIESAVATAMTALASAARAITGAGLLPLIALIIEPAKVLFVNNAINHGVLAPLGIAEAKAAGKSIFFLLESNPGPGLGLLAAYALFGKGAARTSAPGAIVIQFLGGIHELYFPYVLMNPLTIIAVIAGGLAGDAVFVAMRAGLVATPSPGSIFAEIAMAPRGGLLPVLLGIGAAAVVSLVVAAPLVRRSEAADAPPIPGMAPPAAVESTPQARGPVLFVCEAGMGSSVMGQSILKPKLRQAGIDVAVDHAALSALPPRPGIIVAHRSLAARIRELAPAAEICVVDDFINAPVYDELVRRLSPVVTKG